MSTQSKRYLTALFAAAILTFPQHVLATTFNSFYGLGDLTGGSINSRAFGVSSDGSFVVGRSQSTSGSEAFLYNSSTGMVGLGFLAPEITFPISESVAVSADGNVVGRSRYNNNGRSEAYVYSASSGMVGLGSLAGDNNYNTLASGISGDGGVISGTDRSAGDRAFRYTSLDGMVGLGSLAGHAFSDANGISDDGGTIVGKSYGFTGAARRTEAFIHTELDGMIGIGVLSGQGTSEAIAVSADGSVVVGQANAGAGSRAFRYTSTEGMVDIGEGEASGVSGDGSIVVGDGRGFTDAFIWDEQNGMRSIEELLTADGFDLSSWDIDGVTAISTDGSTIVGYGRHAGNDEAFLARLGPAPVPIPAAVWLLGSALIGLVGFRRKKIA